MKEKLVPVLAVILITAVMVLAFVASTGAFRGPDPSTTLPRGLATTAPTVTPSAGTTPSARTAAAPSPPTRIVIPAIHVNAPVMPVGLVSGSVGVPPLNDHNLTAWYTGTVSPGQNGPSLIDGHVDSVTGPSVFYNLKLLHKGDAVTVYRQDGRAVTFHVSWAQVSVKSAFPWKEVLKATPGPELRLVTCGGAFNYQTGHYVDNIIVYAN
jgi:hypothetical protein